MQPRNPVNLQEWQEAADMAEFLTLVDSARKYGLIKGGPQQVDLDRCVEILRDAEVLGIRPAPHAELFARFLHE